MTVVMSVLHVAAAVFLAGPMAILPMTGLRAMRHGDADRAASLARQTLLVSLLSILIIIFGFGILGVTGRSASVTAPWILWSLIAWLVAILLSLLVTVPRLRRVARTAGQPRAATGGYAVVSSSSGITALLLLLAVVLMVWKP
jgi:uncharacterized membrane protein